MLQICTNEFQVEMCYRPASEHSTACAQVAVLYALAEWRLSESKPVRETLLTAVRVIQC